MKTYLTIIILFFVIISGLKSQNLDIHKWENRTLVLYADESSNPIIKEQFELLKKVVTDLKERKLMIYTFSKNKYLKGLNLKNKWKDQTTDIKKYFTPKRKFEIVLIGLDGYIKLRQNELLIPEKLFAIIDAMPMRKNELKKSGY